MRPSVCVCVYVCMCVFSVHQTLCHHSLMPTHHSHLHYTTPSMQRAEQEGAICDAPEPSCNEPLQVRLTESI
jgi:hypothetical protein